MTVAERFATFRYYCLMPVYARVGLTLTYYQWIDSILSETPVLSAFNRISQDKAIRTFSEKDTEQFEISKAKIRAELSTKRPWTILSKTFEGSGLEG